MAANASQAEEQDKPIFGQFLARYTDEFYLVSRLLFAFIVALHGAQKAFLSGASPLITLWVGRLMWPAGLSSSLRCSSLPAYSPGWEPARCV